jgi:hypothetical protein
LPETSGDFAVCEHPASIPAATIASSAGQRVTVLMCNVGSSIQPGADSGPKWNAWPAPNRGFADSQVVHFGAGFAGLRVAAV